MTTLEQKLQNKDALIGIVGLGYVGLPLAVAFAGAGSRVLGFDINPQNVESIRRGESYISDVSGERITSAISDGRLDATTDQSRLTEPDVICVCVPTPLTKSKEPDLSYVIAEAEEVCKCLRREQLVVLESTTYPGTTTGVVLPILLKSGLKAGEDFYLAYSPERVDPGSRAYTIRNTPKIVGGIDAASARLARLLYETVADMVYVVSKPEVAEMTKIFENVFRSVNIALVNELTMLCEKMGMSVWEVIDAAATKPFGFMPFYPGPGIGGHCIPLDPYYLANKAREYDFHTRFIELAADINEHMPYYVANRIAEALNQHGRGLSGARILVLGVAYKRDVDDVRESPSIRLIRVLLEKGAVVRYNDPHVAHVEIGGQTLNSVQVTDDLLSLIDCVVIATDHSDYDYESIVEHASLAFDARGATKALRNGNIVRL